MKKVKGIIAIVLLFSMVSMQYKSQQTVSASNSNDDWHMMEGGITIVPGTPGIAIEPNDNLYYGNYPIKKQELYEPLKWNIMESKTNAIYAALGNLIYADTGALIPVSGVQSLNYADPYAFDEETNAWYGVDSVIYEESKIPELSSTYRFFELRAKSGWNTSYMRAWLNGLSAKEMEKYGYLNINKNPSSSTYFNTPLTQEEIDSAKSAPLQGERKFAFDENTQFYSNAFSKEEKVGILITQRTPKQTFLGNIVNSTDPDVENMLKPYIQPRVQTEDKIFLMSMDELKRFRTAGVSGNVVANYRGEYYEFLLEDMTDIAQKRRGTDSLYYGGNAFALSKGWTTQDPWSSMGSGGNPRPCMNIDQDMIYYKSYAKDGKTTTEGDITVYNNYTRGGDFKLTLKDETSNVTLTEKESKKVYQNQGLQLSYKDATLGDNQYLSCVFINNTDGFKYYGRIKATKTEGDKAGVLSVPTKNVDPGTYTVHVYSEKYNGDYKTDYASRPQIMEVNVLAGDPISVETKQPTAVDNVIATLNGKTTGTGVIEQGFEIKEGNHSWQKVDASLIENDNGNITAKIDNLKPNTQYTYRSYATKNGTDMIYGASISFTTKRAAIAVDEKENLILGAEATYWENEVVSFEAIGSNIDNVDPVLNDERYVPVSWIVDDQETRFTDTTRSTRYLGNYAAKKDNLFIKFEKQMYDGTQWQNQSKFVLKEAKIKVLHRALLETDGIETLAPGTVILKGKLKKNDETIKELGFEYKKSEEATFLTVKVEANNDAFSTMLYNLAVNQEYEYRTYMKTNEKTDIVYGETKNFISTNNPIKPVTPNDNGTQSGSSGKTSTGDSTNTNLWYGLIVVSLGVGVVMIKRSKKNKKDSM